MSKKKSFSGSTMTLKDFHGGSIPSDLSLPSAPGVSPRPPDRLGAWGAGGGRGDHGNARPRPGSAGGHVGIDDRSVALHFLPSSSAHIGRHFDEDERKPFDAAAALAPRRTLAEPVRVPPPQPARPRSSSSIPSTAPKGPWANPWAARKEEPLPPPSSPFTAISSSAPVIGPSKLIHASAVEKVASGLWQVRPPPESEVKVVRLPENHDMNRDFQENVRIHKKIGEREKEAERSLVEANAGVALDSEHRERSATGLYSDGSRPTSSTGKPSGLHMNHNTPVDATERPKLKLLPRSKPLDPSEAHYIDDKQVVQAYQSCPSIEALQMTSTNELHRNSNNIHKPTGNDERGQLMERPKLNLKPRSQSAEQSEGNFERERKSVFAGARPRELVLKDRGMNTVDNLDTTTPTNRIKHDIPKTDVKQELLYASTKHAEGLEWVLPERRSARDLERKNPHVDKVHTHGGGSWRNDNQKSIRETEKAVEPHRQEPATWQKPVEELKPDIAAPRLGKVASAMELAQAFSNSVSRDQKVAPGRPQASFTRLTESSRDAYVGRPQRHTNRVLI